MIILISDADRSRFKAEIEQIKLTYKPGISRVQAIDQVIMRFKRAHPHAFRG